MPERMIEQAGNLGWLAGAFTVLYQTYRKLRAREAHKEDVGTRKAIEALQKQVAEILAQMRPNGGGSIRDDLTAIRGELRNMRKQMVMESAMSRMSFDMSDRVVWQTYPDGRMKFMSAAIERWTGRTPEDMLGEDWRNALHDGDSERVSRIWGQVIEQRRSLEISFRFVGKREQPVQVFVHGYPQFDEGRDGEFTGWVGYMVRQEQGA